MFPNGFDKFGRYIWIKKTDHWEFYEGRFNIKGTFLIELANIVKSTKNISNQSEKTDALTILENVLAGRKTEIENLYKDIGGLSKLSLAQDIYFNKAKLQLAKVRNNKMFLQQKIKLDKHCSFR